MAEPSQKKKIWGWMFFDWASQPYNTLLLTFVFGPYFAQIVTNDLIGGGMSSDVAKAEAQALWGYGLTVADIDGDGRQDLVAIGRALLQDPEWAKKVKEGRVSELRDYDGKALATLY